MRCLPVPIFLFVAACITSHAPEAPDAALLDAGDGAVVDSGIEPRDSRPRDPPPDTDASGPPDSGETTDAATPDAERPAPDGGEITDAATPDSGAEPDAGPRPGDACSGWDEIPCRVPGAHGVCALGTLRCYYDRWSDCLDPPFVPHAAEYCGNELDDDCYGGTDEGCGPACENYEICDNGTDDDCDGQADGGDCDLCEFPPCVTWRIPPGEFDYGADESGEWGVCVEALLCPERDSDWAPTAFRCAEH